MGRGSGPSSYLPLQINGKQFTLPLTNKVRGVSISASGIYTVLSVYIGLQVKFDGSGFLEIELPRAYYGKVRKTPVFS